MIKNRIKKNLKSRKPWLTEKIEAFRLYDRDIPEYPFIVEIFKDKAVVWKKTDEQIDNGKEHHFNDLLEAIEEVMGISKSNIHTKERNKKSGTEQYEKLNRKQDTFTVNEFNAKYLVNLHDYLDTGLFLDHRPLRKDIQKFKDAKGKCMLNLFCYTGSISIAAALAGFKTTSIDLSKTYLDWASQNFKTNQIDQTDHQIIRADVLEWLKQDIDKTYELIFFDPPTFSNSKKMEEIFEVQKDHIWMIKLCMDRLAHDGILYFSNNKRKFKLAKEIENKYEVYDITEKSIPPDFHDKKIHHLFKIRHKK